MGGDILAAWSIGHLELSSVEPLLTTYLIFALVLAVPLSGHAFRLREVIGAVILVTGVALLSASRSAKPAGVSFGSVSHWPAAAGIAAIAFILVEAGRRRSGRLRAALTGSAAVLVLGIQDALTRQTLEALQGNSFTVLFSTWPAYALAGAGALGIWLTQNAFSAGPLQASLPAISAGEPLIGILLGVIVFGDRIQISPGVLAIQAGGVAVLVAGVVMVASDPALSQLREQASKLRSAVRDTASHATLTSQPGRSGADAAVSGPPGDAISSGASPGDPAQGGVVPGGLPDGDMQGGTARGGVNSRTAPGGVNSSAMPGAANSRTAPDGAKEGPIPGQQVAGDRGGAEMIADQRAQAAVGPMVARRAASWLPPARTASGTSTANSHFIPDSEVDGRSPVR